MGSKKHECFWCGIKMKLHEKTRDHLFSKFLRRQYGPNPYCVCSCKICNGERGGLSLLYEMVWRFRYNRWGQWNAHQGRVPSVSDALKSVRKVLSRIDVMRYRNKIETIHHKRARQICLLEIDDLLLIQRWLTMMKVRENAELLVGTRRV